MLTNLPHRISLMAPSRTFFQAGCYSTTLLSRGVEWANVQRINMNNNVQNYKDQQFNFYKVTMRYSGTIDNSMVVDWNNKQLKINSVSDGSNRGNMIRLDCEEELNNGG